jgi:hypothetical protein
MALLSRIALVFFAVFFVTPVAGLFYFLIAGIFATAVLGIKNDTFDLILYFLCSAAGFATAMYLVYRLWSKAEHPRRPPDEW